MGMILKPDHLDDFRASSHDELTYSDPGLGDSWRSFRERTADPSRYQGPPTEALPEQLNLILKQTLDGVNRVELKANEPGRFQVVLTAVPAAGSREPREWVDYQLDDDDDLRSAPVYPEAYGLCDGSIDYSITIRESARDRGDAVPVPQAMDAFSFLQSEIESFRNSPGRAEAIAQHATYSIYRLSRPIAEQ